MKWYIKVLKQYADFKGRARREEYWMFTLFQIIFGVTAMIIDNLLNSTIYPLPYGYIYLLFILITFIPSFALAIRRLHDVGKSGWMSLIVLIPIIGAIWILVLFVTDGQKEINKWGPNPKEI